MELDHEWQTLNYYVKYFAQDALVEHLNNSNYKYRSSQAMCRRESEHAEEVNKMNYEYQ